VISTTAAGSATATTCRRARGPIALLSIARLAWGGTLLVVPGTTLAILGGSSADTPAWQLVARILRLRQAVQGALQLRASLRCSDPRTLLYAGVDGLHLLSDIALAASDRDRRRLAFADAVIAGSSTMIEALSARRDCIHDGARS
jgi:hypothetical protein